MITEDKMTHSKEVKKKLLQLSFLLLVFAITIIIVYKICKNLSKGSIASLQDVVSNINYTNLFLLILLVATLFLTDALKYSIIIKIATDKFDYGFCINLGIMGRFYDNITPFNTGGQAYQMYQLSKRGYSGDVAAAVPIIKYIFQLISWIFVSFILFIVNYKILHDNSTDLNVSIAVVSYVGLFVASLAPIVVILFSLFPRTMHSVICFFLKIGVKLKIIKDYDKKSETIFKFLNKYNEAFVKINKNALGVISLILISILDFILVMALPLFVMASLNIISFSGKSFFDVITLNSYTLFAASLVPTPGNSGAIETSFTVLLSNFSQNQIIWIVFFWRFCSYFIYIIIGFVETILLFIGKFVNNKKVNKTTERD